MKRDKRKLNAMIEERARIQKERFKNVTDFTFDFWNLPDPKPIDNTVHVWTDLSILNKKEVKNNYTDDLLEKEDMGINNTKKADLGFQKAMERERNLTKLTNLIDEGEVKTVEEALKHFPAIKTHRTLHKYLHIIGRKLFDEEAKREYGSDEPHFDELYVKQSKKGNIAIPYRYYDKDPKTGGKELSKDAYLAHREKLFEDAGVKVKTKKKSAGRKSTGFMNTDELIKMKQDKGEL